MGMVNIYTQKDTYQHMQSNTYTCIHIFTDTTRHAYIHIHAYIQTDNAMQKTSVRTYIHTERYTYIQTEKQIGRQTDRQTDRQTPYRQTTNTIDRQRDTIRQSDTYT